MYTNCFRLIQIFGILTLPSKQKEDILFVGNNAHRDFSKVIEITKQLPDKKFKIVSSNIDEKIIPNNVQLIKGDWNKNILSIKI